MDLLVLLVVSLLFYSKVFVIIIMEVYVIHSHNNQLSLAFLANWQTILLNSHWHGSNTHTYFQTLTHHLHLLQDYFDIIKKLMDLSTIQSKLEDGVYHSPWQFINDVWLMFENFWLSERFTESVLRCVGFLASNVYKSTFTSHMRCLCWLDQRNSKLLINCDLPW